MSVIVKKEEAPKLDRRDRSNPQFLALLSLLPILIVIVSIFFAVFNTRCAAHGEDVCLMITGEMIDRFFVATTKARGGKNNARRIWRWLFTAAF